MGYSRRPPHTERVSLDAEYIEKIMNPSTPEDLTLALREPLSPVYREFVNLMQHDLEIEIIIERLIEKFVLKQHHLRQKEKEAFLLQMHIKSESDKDFSIYLVREKEKNARLQEEILLATRAKLNEIEKDLKRRMEKSEIQIEKTNKTLRQLQTQKDSNTQDYKDHIMSTFKSNENDMTFVTSKLNQNKEHVLVPLDKPIEQLRQLVDESVPPVDVVNVVEKSYEEAQKAHSIAMAQVTSSVQFIPPPPPPPLIKPKAAHYSAHDRLNLEFKFITQKLADSTNPSDILNAIKENKCLNKVFSMTEDVKREQCAIFEEAIEIGGKMRNAIHRLELARESYQQDAELFDALQKRKQQLDMDEKSIKSGARNSHL